MNAATVPRSAEVSVEVRENAGALWPGIWSVR